MWGSDHGMKELVHPQFQMSVLSKLSDMELGLLYLEALTLENLAVVVHGLPH